MKKMLMVASVASMIDQFNMENIKILHELGYEVHVAANFITGNTCSNQRLHDFENELKEISVISHQVDFSRNIISIIENYKAYRQILRLINTNQYDFIHCHSPIGGVCARLAAHKTGVKVIYTAHGFHFYKCAPIKNWILFYPIERYCSKYTNILITINREDYTIAQKFKAKKIINIPGIGIDTEKFKIDQRLKYMLRKQLDIPENATVILSVGELSERKNHRIVIKALAELKNSNIIYIICGQGKLDKYLKDLALEQNISLKLFGFIQDMTKVYAAADIFVFPSVQEGLPVALMEAMSAGLPIICSDIRGNRDLIKHGLGGYLVETNNYKDYIHSIEKLLSNNTVAKSMKEYNQNIINNYDIKKVNQIMRDIYQQISLQ